MTQDEIRKAVLRILAAIAPEADLTKLDRTVPFREQLDIDSMDLLNFFIALEKELHVVVPETDYPKVATLDGVVGYVTANLSSSVRADPPS